MKRHIIILATILIPFFLQAEQMPEGYYSSADGKHDAELKTALSNICKGGTRVPYGSDALHTTDNPPQWQKGDWKSMATWGAFFLTDQKSDGSVWDMYGPQTRYFPLKGQSGAGLDIEHGFPKSWWGGADNDAYKDLYHLSPADMYANGNKSNYPPGYVPVADKFDNGVFRMGKNPAYGDSATYVFEPADCYKGDFARAYFYIATAYEDFTWLSDFSTYITNDSYLEFQPWLIKVLLEWHRLDPVGEKELNRANAISSIQHNRNPYIDYPELVEYIWGNKQGEDVDFSTLTFTGSNTYTYIGENDNPLAFKPQDLDEQGFTASWNNTGAEEYTLEVFHKTTIGTNDTLLNVPIVKAADITANPNITWQKEDGSSSTYSTTDGGGAFYMSTTTEKRRFFINGLNIGNNARLVVRCSIYNKGDQNAVLVVIADGDTLAQQDVTLDERYYSFPLSAGTQEIVLIQKEIGKKQAYHRISMQQIFIIQGDEQTTEIAVEGYPVTLTSLAHRVDIVMPEDEPVYYRVTPKSLRTSNTVEVCRHSVTPTSLSEVTSQPPFTQTASPQAKPKKVIIGNSIYILLPDGRRYSILGTEFK